MFALDWIQTKRKKHFSMLKVLIFSLIMIKYLPKKKNKTNFCRHFNCVYHHCTEAVVIVSQRKIRSLFAHNEINWSHINRHFSSFHYVTLVFWMIIKWRILIANSTNSIWKRLSQPKEFQVKVESKISVAGTSKYRIMKESTP